MTTIEPTMTDAQIHDALFKHALTEQGWAGEGADISKIPLKKLLEVEEAAGNNGLFHVDPRAVAAIYVAFHYEGEKGQCSSPVVIANNQAVCVVKLEDKEKDEAPTFDVSKRWEGTMYNRPGDERNPDGL